MELTSNSNLQEEMYDNSISSSKTILSTTIVMNAYDYSIFGVSSQTKIFFDDDTNINTNHSDIIKKSNCLKYLFMANTRRTKNAYFDLDLTQITRKLYVMSFPYTGCKGLFFNSLIDIKNYFTREKIQYKVYNLTANKTYDRKLFSPFEIAFFPVFEDEPCSPEMMLLFIIDIILCCNNNNRIAVIHCDDGLRKCGILVCAYMVVMKMFKDVVSSVNYYIAKRLESFSKIISQSDKRYIEYLILFLKVNYGEDLIKKLPLIIRNDFILEAFSILTNYSNERFSKLKFNEYTNTIINLSSITIGPFNNDTKFKFSLHSGDTDKENFPNCYMMKELKENYWYYKIVFPEKQREICYNIKLSISSHKLKFFCWFNLFFSAIEIINESIIDKEKFLNTVRERKVIVNDKYPTPIKFSSNLSQIIDIVNSLQSTTNKINKKKMVNSIEKQKLDITKDSTNKENFKVDYVYSID